MGGSQSQETSSQTFSTIGLPPSSLYSQPQRSHSLRVPGDNDSATRRRYQPTQVSEADDDWLRVDRTPPASSAPQPPRINHNRPLPPPPPPQARPPTRPPQRQPDHRIRQSLGDSDAMMDIEQLLSTLHSLQLQSRSSGQGSSDSSSDRDERRRRHGSSGSGRPRRLRQAAGPPLFFIRPVQKEKCPTCSKEFPQPELVEHLPVCAAKPRVQYNEDKLNHDAGECSICLDDLVTGDKIARLPCLCVYHLKCLKGWYKKSQTCPEHPDMK